MTYLTKSSGKMGFGSPSRISERKLREGAQLKSKVTARRNSASVPSKWPASRNKANKGNKEWGGKERTKGRRYANKRKARRGWNGKSK